MLSALTNKVLVDRQSQTLQSPSKIKNENKWTKSVAIAVNNLRKIQKYQVIPF